MVVASPIEAPAKDDYGDVDVFVAWDAGDTPLGNFEDVSKLLGTTHTRVEQLVMCEAQFAVPVSLLQYLRVLRYHHQCMVSSPQCRFPALRDTRASDTNNDFAVARRT